MDYMRRAGELKKVLHPDEATTSCVPSLSSSERSPSQVLHARTSVEADQFQELLQLSHMTPKLATGLEIARAAEEYELEAQFVVALEKYQVGENSACSILLQCVPSGLRSLADLDSDDPDPPMLPNKPPSQLYQVSICPRDYFCRMLNNPNPSQPNFLALLMCIEERKSNLFRYFLVYSRRSAS